MMVSENSSSRVAEFFYSAFTKLQQRFPGISIIYERMCKELAVPEEKAVIECFVNDIERFYNALVKVMGLHVAAHAHIFTLMKILSDELGVDVKIERIIGILRRRDFASWRSLMNEISSELSKKHQL